jgi:hypothetical protein
VGHFKLKKVVFFSLRLIFKFVSFILLSLRFSTHHSIFTGILAEHLIITFWTFVSKNRSGIPLLKLKYWLFFIEMIHYFCHFIVLLCTEIYVLKFYCLAKSIQIYTSCKKVNLKTLTRIGNFTISLVSLPA